jgi:hypothetical protein
MKEMMIERWERSTEGKKRSRGFAYVGMGGLGDSEKVLGVMPASWKE